MKPRRKTIPVQVGNITIGGGNPIAVQSMTSTDTSNVQATAQQIIELAEAGSELIRITVDSSESAEAVPRIYAIVSKKTAVPIVGDFHFNGHVLLSKYPETAQLLEKYRINPGNVGRGNGRDANFEAILEIAAKYEKPIRIGVNGGSLDPELLDANIEKNREQNYPFSDAEVFEQTMVESAIISSEFAIRFGIPKEKIILSAKTSDVPGLIRIHKALAQKTDLAIHLGLTEAGSGMSGIVATTSALSTLLSQGIGDTIRVSITPESGEARTKEVQVAREILQALELRTFTPKVASCPGCGRTTGNDFQLFTEEIKKEINAKLPDWQARYVGAEKLRIAVMGCVVNGPGEARAADIGIFFPGKGEGKLATVFANGEKVADLSGNGIKEEFFGIVEKYLKTSS